MTFHDQFVELFETHYGRLFRFLDRLTGDPDQAADLAQEAYVRLYRRRALPDDPPAWLVTVALNLLRNERSSGTRHARLLGGSRAGGLQGDPAGLPSDAALAAETRQQVRRVLDRMGERDRQLLLLRAEGYSYRDIATALAMNPASVGTLLARAQREFRQAWEESVNAHR